MIRVIHGYLHAQLEIPDKKGFSRREPQCHPTPGNFTHGLPVGPEFSKGAAPRRKALRAARGRAWTIATESKKWVRTPHILAKSKKAFFIASKKT